MKGLILVIVILFVAGAAIAKRPALTNQEVYLSPFKIGDDVVLLTGSQIMTVEELLPNGKVACNFLSRRDHTYRVGTFNAVDLQKIDILINRAIE